MRQAGFSPGSAAWIDVLSEHLPMPETVERYSQLASEAFASADVVTATLGAPVFIWLLLKAGR